MMSRHFREKNSQVSLGIYDLIAFLCVETVLFFVDHGNEYLSINDAAVQLALSLICVFGVRILGGIYHQIWRYGGIGSYMKLMLVDGCAFVVNFAVKSILPVRHVPFGILLLISCANLLCALAMRMTYHYAYRYSGGKSFFSRFLRALLRLFAGNRISVDDLGNTEKIRVAIIGAGKVGVTLADELFGNVYTEYVPVCFIDSDKNKIGRELRGLPVLANDGNLWDFLKQREVGNIVIAIPNLSETEKKELAGRFLSNGLGVKVYDFPEMRSADGKRRLREFTLEELLSRAPIQMLSEQTVDYYRGKRILVTGGGGSIGSEICRQLAQMQPDRIIILDICENGAYEVQQELRMVYGSALDVAIEIVSITNKKGLARVFEQHRPQIVINSAAHKHVPLMEHNCIEAVENNVFGTCNLVELSEDYEVERFLMVSTDKAVNPTNVMGATKRVCEMVALGASTYGSVKYSATRFGNVLGSAGSVIPLFKKQIAGGGPVTITDRRITRFFMTIPEAVQLVLQSGVMANNGELFVLDMGKPVKILDLAENMIRLSGARDIEIIEVGLRPGEKLYEELLIKTETMTKTENDLIYIEKDRLLDRSEIDAVISKLKSACETDEDSLVRQALKEVVPEYRAPEEVNAVFDNAAQPDVPAAEALPEEIGQKVLVGC